MQELPQVIADQFKGASDFIHRRLHREQTEITLMYMLTVADEQKIFDLIIHPFYSIDMKDTFVDYVQSMPRQVALKDAKKTAGLMAEGYALLVMKSGVFLIDFRKFPNSAIREATVETVIQGPQNAFSEDIGTNITLLRQRYTRPSLMVESASVGKATQTALTLLYDSAAADPKLVDDMKRRIKEINVPVVQSAGQMAQLLGQPTRTLFPQLMITERPDRTALNITQGKIVVLMEGTPFALIAPATFFDFFASMEDLYQQYFITRFLAVLRYVSLLVSLTLPAGYVAVAGYNPEVLRAQLALSIAGSRVAVPYPAFLEVLFMLVAMELLIEASIRLPKSIGSTATTVGGLILGTAATEAGLVSSIMIIIVATVAISNFVVPVNAMSFALRVAKYALLLLSAMFGLLGIVLGLVAMVGYLVSLDSFGQPYLKLYENDDRAEKATQRQNGNAA